MQTHLLLEPAKRLRPRLSASEDPDQIAESVIAAPTALPEEYWYPAVHRPRRASLWNTLNHARHIQPA